MPKKRQKKRRITFEKAVRQIAHKNKRYAPEAYFFIFDALSETQQTMMAKRPPDGPEFHVTGQELLEGIREHARKEFGYMAKTVFEEWGVTSTEDFGRIVFHLVDGGLMRKTESDSLDDFRNSYDFSSAFESDRLYFDEWKVGHN